MLTRKTLKRVNERPRQVNRLPLVAIGAGALVLAGLLVLLASSLLAGLVVIVAGVAGGAVYYRSRRAAAITSVTYGELKGELRERGSKVQEACEALSSSEKIWRLRGPVEQRSARTGDAAPTPAREPACVGLLETPGIRTDVPIWGIEAGDTRVFFFPEAVLIYRDERYEGVSYESLGVAISSFRFYEREEVPGDAQVVAGQSGRSRMPVVRYALVEISHPRGLDLSLQVSGRDCAARFAAAFGAEEAREERGPNRQRRGKKEESRTNAYQDSLTMKERARLASAYTTLGVRRGASMSEISSAYKQLARMYHPDKVAMLEPEEREASERRMKEINAAYMELKRLGRYLADGAG